MNSQITNREDLDNFYRNKFEGKSSLFDIWEGGGANGDSVTPSTYNTEYRSWMSEKLITELKRNGDGLLSLGAGNGAVEADVAHRGFRVLAVDAMEEAVALVQQKGLEAVCADLYQWTPEESWPVVYMDGLLGHLYSPQHGLRPVFERVYPWLLSVTGGATLVASNDAPKDGNDVQQAPGVDGFHWLSAQYMRDQAFEAGFEDSLIEEFRYQRPLSGERVRAIVTWQVKQ